MSLEQLGRLQVYLVAYVGVSLLVSLWVLPGLVAALSGIRVGEILGRTRNALITAFVAGDLFIVLPVLIESSRDLLDQHGLVKSQGSPLPDVIVPASFNFPHTGKLLSISFVLFAAWFADAALAPGDYPRLALTGLVTFFGSLNVAIPFLLDQFRIPADTFQLFLASGVINSRFGTLVATVHTLTVALLGACAMSGALRWNRRRVLRYAVVTVALTVAVLGGTRLLFAQVLNQTYTKDQVLAGMHLLRGPVQPAVRLSTPPVSVRDEGPRPGAIRSRGVLRVGHLPGSLPFAFVNEAGDLVGFDIELAHRLASELDVRLEFVPLDRTGWAAQLSAGACDLVMSGIAVTTERASGMLFTASYLDETVGLVVPDGTRARFSSWADIRRSGPLTIAAPDVPYYIAMLRDLLPNATVRVFQDIETTMARPSPDVDAIALPVERGSAWTLLYPQYSVIVPEPAGIRVPLAYPLAGDDQGFARFMNIWIDLKRKDGTMDALYQYWILGRNAEAPRPRWSVIRDVLHWVD
jgi:ABC-type amino acid transport substrate-binding protein